MLQYNQIILVTCVGQTLYFCNSKTLLFYVSRFMSGILFKSPGFFIFVNICFLSNKEAKGSILLGSRIGSKIQLKILNKATKINFRFSRFYLWFTTISRLLCLASHLNIWTWTCICTCIYSVFYQRVHDNNTVVSDICHPVWESNLV